MRNIILVLIYFVIIHTVSGDIPVRYEGMEKDVIVDLISNTYENSEYDFVSKEAYVALVAAHAPMQL